MTQAKISEIGANFFLVRSGERDFHRNIYFKKFSNNGQNINMIFDPGTKLDGDLVMDASKKLFGGVQNIDIIFLSHQDPDVSSLAPFILAGSKKSVLLTSIDTFRLVSMYGISEKRVMLIENLKSEILTIKKTGHKIRFVPAYYCHFRGAMMFFDYESKILFSGDFAAGINTRKGDGIFATEESWEGIKAFHTIYMPSNSAVRETVDRIGLMNPLPEIIAPQHGDVIKGEYTIEFLTRLSEIEIGIDYLKKIEPQKELLIETISSFIDRLKTAFPDEWKKLKEELKKPGQFTTVFKIIDETILDIKIDYLDALRYLIDSIERLSNPENIDQIKTFLNFELENHNLILPIEIQNKLKSEDKEIEINSLLY